MRQDKNEDHDDLFLEDISRAKLIDDLLLEKGMGDADSLILKPAFLSETIREIKRHFPTLKRFTVYGQTKTAASVRNLEYLKAFREAGLNRVHFGVESGSDAVLRFVRKGVTSISPSDQRRFSLESRLRSFVGQYGGLSEDISRTLWPYMANQRLNLSMIPDTEVDGLIRLIRAKLMP